MQEVLEEVRQAVRRTLRSEVAVVAVIALLLYWTLVKAGCAGEWRAQFIILTVVALSFVFVFGVLNSMLSYKLVANKHAVLLCQILRLLRRWRNRTPGAFSTLRGLKEDPELEALADSITSERYVLCDKPRSASLIGIGVQQRRDEAAD